MYKKKNKFLLVFIVITTIFLFVMFYLLNTNTTFFSGIIKDIIYVPSRMIKNNEELSFNINKELESENKELKSLLKIRNSISEFDVINASVIERNTAYWFNTITINKGSRDGIKKGMAVITNGGIIGKIDNTSNLVSTVRLITSNDKDNKISVVIKSKKDYNAILKTLDNGDMVIEGLDKDIEIENGNNVVTSGLSDIFPRGIIIGKIKSIELDKYASSKKALVESLTDINNIRFVSVLKRK